MSRYVIKVIGCDDRTLIVRDLDDTLAAFMREICAQVTAASEYGCMPIMEIDDAAGYCEHGKEIGEWCAKCPDEMAVAA